jgi:hypothetical protein
MENLIETPQAVLSLQKVLGPEGSICVHVPITLNDIQECREKLGRDTENTDKFTVGFRPWH